LGQLKPTASGSKALSEAVKRSLYLGKVKGRTLFFILTDLETKAEVAALRQLVAMSHEVIIISPYTALFESHNLGGLDRVIFSIRTSYHWRTRQELVREAAIDGIPLLDVGPKDLFSSLVQRVEDHRRLGGS